MSVVIQSSKDYEAKDALGTYRRLLRYARPYSGRLWVGFILGIIFAGSQTALLPVLRESLSRFFNPETMSLHAVLWITGILFTVAIVRGIGFYFSVYLIEWVGNRVVRDLREDTFTHLMDASVQYYTKSRTGQIISRTISDTQMVERAVSTVLGDLARQPFVLLGAIAYMLYLNWGLALMSFVVFPVCILPVAIFGKRVRQFSKEGQDKLGDLASIIHESVYGVKIIKAFGMESYEKGRFFQRARAVFSRAMKVTRAKAAIEPIIVLISVVGVSAVMFYAYWTHMPLEDFLTFVVALIAMYEPVKKLSKIHLNIQRASASADRVFEILDTDIAVQDHPDAVAFDEKLESITFENVSFAYEKAPVLSGLNLHVRAGECVALVGSSGSGKTTLVNLLPRFFDVTAGKVLFNGADIRSYTMKSIRSQIGIVTQDTILFNDTVSHNISYGTEDASPEAIEEAAGLANASAFIAELPNGYETVIGERGVSLSGGQCQRLAIARALLRNPPLLILDEATSALDSESERLVQGALEHLMEGRTVFAIAHRLSTIAQADRILVLDKGHVVEEGNHQELLARGGQYKYLYDLQFEDPAAATGEG